jgi:ribosomal protein S12 methylthiotransferase
MALLLQRAGYQPTLDPDDADVVIVNTCGFIELAREESLETLEDLTAMLRPEQRIVAAGCWAQREPEAIRSAVPEIDAFLGTRSWARIVELANELLSAPGGTTLSLIEDNLAILPEQADAPGYVISGPSAFLKISEGCSRECAFCAIPDIKGPSVSRSMDAVLADAQQLDDLGVLEINLIAQDVTYYGYDLGLQDGLAQLLERLTDEVPDVPWIRLLYAFPGYISTRLIDVMQRRPQVLPYIDIPLQHAHPDVLRRMRRPADMDRVRRTLTTLRARLPGVALRTTLIVGFPGETEEEFDTLLDFVRDVRFDRLGVFEYSHEPGTVAAKMADDVPAEVKTERYEAVMVTQQAISREKNRAFVGQRLPVLLEGAGDGVTVGRSYRDAPEIDGVVLIQDEMETHRLVTVEITEALVYDMIGRAVSDEG